MQVQAVAPANPAPIVQTPSAKAETGAIGFGETLARVQAKRREDVEASPPELPAGEDAPFEEVQPESDESAAEVEVPDAIEGDVRLANQPADTELDEPEEPAAARESDAPLPLTAAVLQAAEPRGEQEPVATGEPVADIEAMPARPGHAVVGQESTLPRREVHGAPEVEPAAAPRIEKPCSDSMPAAEPMEPLPARAETVAGPQADPLKQAPAIPAEPAANVPIMAPAPSASPAVPSPAPVAPPTPAPLPQEAEFAEVNHPAMVSAIRAQALPDGGRMQIRLDPPQLGSLAIQVEVRDGVLTASFQTSNDEATRLLSHSLSRLKHSLESQGMSIDRLHVQQMARDERASADQQDGSQRQQQPQEQAGQQEQQRREMLRRLWRRVAGEQDPLDVWA